MRRAVPTAVLTLVGLGALASFKSSPAATKAAPTPATHSSTMAPSATTPPTTAPSTTAPSASSPASSPPATSSVTRTIDGDPFTNRYGTVQVRVTLQGSHITAIDELQMPFDRARSQYISQQAGPYLHDETLQAQSAHIDVVSGATYTSESYIQSLQSALDKAHG